MSDTAVALLTPTEILAGLQTVQSVLAPDLTPDELKLFAMVANRSGLDPFAKQIYAVKRKGRVTFQTGIDGYRSIAARTGMYDGQDEPEYSAVCGCKEAPPNHPESATVRVYRKGVTRAIAATAFWHEYKPGDNDFMWVRMPRVMIAKVAEALALRKAFPYDPERREGIGADVYTADEMAQADRPERPVVRPLTLAEKAAAKRAEVEGVGISRDDFLAALERAGVSQDTAKARSQALFPGVAGTALTDAQRAELLTDLLGPSTGPVSPEAAGAPSEEPAAVPPALSEADEAELDGALVLPLGKS